MSLPQSWVSQEHSLPAQDRTSSNEPQPLTVHATTTRVLCFLRGVSYPRHSGTFSRCASLDPFSEPLLRCAPLPKPQFHLLRFPCVGLTVTSSTLQAWPSTLSAPARVQSKFACEATQTVLLWLQVHLHAPAACRSPKADRQDEIDLSTTYCFGTCGFNLEVLQGGHTRAGVQSILGNRMLS